MGVILRLVRCRDRQLLLLFPLLLYVITIIIIIIIIHLNLLTTGHIVDVFYCSVRTNRVFTRFDLPLWWIKCLYVKLCENQPVSSSGNDTQIHGMSTTRLEK